MTISDLRPLWRTERKRGISRAQGKGRRAQGAGRRVQGAGAQDPEIVILVPLLGGAGGG